MVQMVGRFPLEPQVGGSNPTKTKTGNQDPLIATLSTEVPYDSSHQYGKSIASVLLLQY